MRHVITLLIFTIVLVSNSFAQYKLQFESFSEEPFDISARTRVKMDSNGEPTAILKIQIPMLRDAVVSSPLKVGDEDYTPGELLVYLGQGSKRVTVKHPDFEAFEYDFPFPLKGKSTYNLVLKLPEEYVSAGEVSVKLNLNVLKANLTLDDKESFHTDNGQFLLRLKPGNYNYVISTPQPGYQDLTGNLTIKDDDLKNSGRVDEYLQLQSNKKSNLHISTVGNSVVKIDGKTPDKNKGVISLPLGRHYVDVESSGHKRSYVIDLLNDNEYLNADVRVPLTFVSPVKAEFTIKPIGDALKPSVAKFKAGDKVNILGTYEVTAKAKGYVDKVFEVTAFPDDKEIRTTVPMISKAHMLQKGLNAKQDIKKAANEYQKLIASGDDVAMWEYGKILMESNGEGRGSTLIKNAAELGNPEAAIYAAANLCNGNTDLMKKYLQKAIDGGDMRAHRLLGDIYSNYPSDPGKAFDEYALCGNTPYSIIRRGQIALHNPDLNKIEPAAMVEMLGTIKESDTSNHSISQQLLGDMAYKGFGMSKSTKKAIEYWESATPKHLSQENLLILAIEHINDDKLDDYVKSLDLNTFNKDFVGYKGMTLIEFLTKAGQNLDKKNVSSAFRLLKKAYDLGDRSMTTLSYLGKYYRDGDGTAKDNKLAKMYLQTAIDTYKNVDSQKKRVAQLMRWLGSVYENEDDLINAEKFYRMAMSDDAFAKGRLGNLLYKKGKKYYPQAAQLWEEAANAGHKESINNLIQYYEKIAKNPSKAAYWKGKK